MSLTRIDQSLRCPLKCRSTYVDRLKPELAPAVRAFDLRDHPAAAFLFNGAATGKGARV